MKRKNINHLFEICSPTEKQKKIMLQGIREGGQPKPLKQQSYRWKWVTISASFVVLSVIILTLGYNLSNNRNKQPDSNTILVGGNTQNENTETELAKNEGESTQQSQVVEGSFVKTRLQDGKLFLDLVYQNNTDEEYTYGEEPNLEIQVGDKWETVALKDNVAWNDIGIILKPRDTNSYTVNLSAYYNIQPGKYRYTKKFYGSQMVEVSVRFDYTSKSDSAVANKVTAADLQVMITPAGSDTYGFKLDSDGLLKAFHGTISDLGIKTKADFNIANMFIKNDGFDFEENKKMLPKNEIDEIAKLLDQISSTKGFKIESYQTDSWEVHIYLSGIEYAFYYGSLQDQCYGKLIEKLIENSPLKVDLHGLA